MQTASETNETNPFNTFFQSFWAFRVLLAITKQTSQLFFLLLVCVWCWRGEWLGGRLRNSFRQLISHDLFLKGIMRGGDWKNLKRQGGGVRVHSNSLKMICKLGQISCYLHLQTWNAFRNITETVGRCDILDILSNGSTDGQTDRRETPTIYNHFEYTPAYPWYESLERTSLLGQAYKHHRVLYSLTFFLLPWPLIYNQFYDVLKQMLIIMSLIALQVQWELTV